MNLFLGRRYVNSIDVAMRVHEYVYRFIIQKERKRRGDKSNSNSA